MKWSEIKQPGFYVYVDENLHGRLDNKITIVQVIKDDEREIYWVWRIGGDQGNLLEHFDGDFWGPIDLENYITV